MPGDRAILLHIALEFGYPEKIVRYVLHKETFEDAAALIDYLMDHIDDLENDPMIENQFNLADEQNIQHCDKSSDAKIALQPEEKDLRAETLQLYLSSKCANPGCDQQKTRVTLPCCHFTLCERCIHHVSICPTSSCDVKIEGSIRTFLS